MRTDGARQVAMLCIEQSDKDKSRCFVSGSLVAVLDGFLSGWLSMWGMHDYMRVN